MRKYFLLSAVALMATTTANATTDYAEVTAKATIQVAGTFECDNGGVIDFGTIVVKQDNEEFVIENGDSASDDLISLDYSPESCTPNTGDFGSDITFSTELKNAGGNKLSLSGYLDSDSEEIQTELTIPSDVPAGVYEGTFTLAQTY
ncbi:MAG: hypothetical protein E7016_02965 [Alphaproteobacteria bacterium]|nr:hypothetical protein [Alphaproteobacteria bacterium]